MIRQSKSFWNRERERPKDILNLLLIYLTSQAAAVCHWKEIGVHCRRIDIFTTNDVQCVCRKKRETVLVCLRLKDFAALSDACRTSKMHTRCTKMARMGMELPKLSHKNIYNVQCVWYELDLCMLHNEAVDQLACEHAQNPFKQSQNIFSRY